MSNFKDTLKANLDGFGLSYTNGQINNCEKYYRYVIKANNYMNLTRITNEQQAAELHFANSVRLLSFIDIPQNCRVIDIGTGAGFPGVPLKLLRPDINLTLLDSSNKKTDFIKSIADAMKLDVTVLCARAEEAAKSDLRESFDIACARAVAPLSVICELCIPFLHVGGIFAAWKGESYNTELKDANKAINKLGCRVRGSQAIGKGAVIIIEKNKPTQDIYPRRYAKIKSEPL